MQHDRHAKLWWKILSPNQTAQIVSKGGLIVLSSFTVCCAMDFGIRFGNFAKESMRNKAVSGITKQTSCQRSPHILRQFNGLAVTSLQ